MSLTGFMKQINKANQMISEKIGNTKGTELDTNYVEMEKHIDACAKLFEEMSSLTETFLQPNPASRALLMTRSALQRVQGKDTHMSYPQPESKLAECFNKSSVDVSKCMPSLATVLHSTGDTFQILADQKYSLEDNVKQNFLLPLASWQTRELKEIAHHRKKVQSRRLDYDCKRRQDKTPGGEGEEVRVARNKFEESRQLAEEAMSTFLDSEMEVIRSLNGFIDATVEYHQQALDELRRLQTSVKEQYREAEQKPRRSVQKFNFNATRSSSSLQSDQSHGDNGPGIGFNVHVDGAGGNNGAVSISEPKLIRKEKITEGGTYQKTPTCRAIYDFNAESQQELAFKEGDIIRLLEQLDENWFYGELHGNKGHFPVDYVEVLVPL